MSHVDAFTSAFVALGGNLADPLETVQRAYTEIVALPGVTATRISRFYMTSPVSDLPQPNYINAVCHLYTRYPLEEFFNLLQHIEMALGKTPKERNAPRVIDIDLLLFGHESCNAPHLQLPHPRWHERLFVLYPLLDVAKSIAIPCQTQPNQLEIIDLVAYLHSFSNPHGEIIRLAN